jgi:hypothetical protein
MPHRKKRNPVDRAWVPQEKAIFKPVFKRRSSHRDGRLTTMLLSGFLCLIAAGTPLPTKAQTVSEAATDTPPDDIRPDELLQDRFNRRISVPGTQIGAVSFQGSAVADLGFNDNLFAQDTGVKSDFFVDYGGKLDADYHDDEFRAHWSLNGSERRYFSQNNEDYWQGGTRLELSDQVFRDLGLFLDGGVQRLSVPRTDPNTINGFKPATYLLYDAEAGTQVGDGAHNLLTVTSGYSQSIYDQSFGSQGLIITNDRDRQEFFGDVRFDHTFFGQQKVFIEVRPDGRSFGREIDASGFKRASNGVRSDAGFQLDINSLFLVSVSSGYQMQFYADPRYGEIDIPDVNAEVLWSPTLLTQLDVKFVHEYYEDLFIESPGYVHDMGTVTLSHELTRNLLLKADVSYDDRQLQRSVRHYDILTSEARADYEIQHALTVGIDYQNQNLTSNTTRSFDQNIIMLTLKKQF